MTSARRHLPYLAIYDERRRVLRTHPQYNRTPVILTVREVWLYQDCHVAARQNEMLIGIISPHGATRRRQSAPIERSMAT